MRKPLIHEPPAPGMPKCYEYFFPVSLADLKPQHQPAVDPWFARFLGREPEQILEMLKADWAKETSSTFAKFTELLLTCKPSSMVFCKNREPVASVWISLKNPELRGGNLMIQSPRPTPDRVLEFVENFPSPDLEEFCRHFYECFEGVDPYTNGLNFEMSLNPSNSNTGLAGWERNIALYHVCNGDFILMNQSGAVCRWYHELGWSTSKESAIRKIADSFAQFIELYIDQLKTDRNAHIFW